MIDLQTFITLFMIFSAINAILTQGVKKFLDQGHFRYQSNIVALIDSVVVGVGGTLIYYYIHEEPANAVIALLMTISVWLASMNMYDKILQVFNQIKETKLQ